MASCQILNSRRENTMVFKPNYNQQRAERNRQKQAKKDAKLRERDEVANRRKLEQDAAPSAPPDSEEPRES
jgi:hypothetical protein